MNETKTIAIIGGGFAGTTLARALDGRLPQGYELVLISEESHTTFNPMLPEALGASIFPEQVVAPIRQMVDHARFVMGRVTALDPRGSMAAIGHRKGVADIFGIPLSGLPAWLLWRAYYLSRMPTLGRKVRILVEWTWGMFFPNDITHLRFTRSEELDRAVN